ncbi:MAG TPA: ATP-binding protein [Pyrinomonadaceae bacterium]|nr:ATP-binding protein [Pyrinomonadaceae bacterium]
MSETTELKLPSRIESVDEAASYAQNFVKDCGFGDDFISAVDLAVRESVANAVKHGNKFDADKHVEMTIECSGTGLEIVVRDFGAGFAPEEIPDPTNPENLLRASGRGIFFMRSFMDEVEWSGHPDGGLIVKMTKRQ